jgi:hypothetical protein
MKRFVLFATLALALVAVTALADTGPQRALGSGGVYTGQTVGMAKASGDTIYLVGDPSNPDHTSDSGVVPGVRGTFQAANGSPSWNGWTTRDYTASSEDYWNVSEFRAINGTYSYWCGRNYPNGEIGYGNDWNYIVQFAHEVANPANPSTVNWQAQIQQDSEPDYDYTFMEWNRNGVWQVLFQFDGDRLYTFNETWTINPGQYAEGDQIQLRIRFFSDAGWSDEDGLYLGDGAVQVDDLRVTVDGVQVEFEDFEDGLAQNWPQVLALSVGDYAQLFVGLFDEDVCTDNSTAQVAFVDDGVIVPGTGGTAGQTWRYGPGGYIVNNTGGLSGPDTYIQNSIETPVLTWPEGTEGGIISFGFYRHEELGDPAIWPGIFYTWDVRSVNTGDPADLEFATWSNRNFVQYGGPDYGRQTEVVTDLLENGRTHMQLRLQVWEIKAGPSWVWNGTDGTPAPYFDNVQVKVYPYAGPGISGRSIDWFQDNFPTIGELDLVTLGNNSVRLDSSLDIAGDDDLEIIPGDSIWFDVKAVVGGSVLEGFPKFNVRMRANPLFDEFRVLPPNFTSTANFFEDNWTLIEGFVVMDSTFAFDDEGEATYIADRWELDLPDENFFYPGDVLKWFVSAQDNLDGQIATSLLPADTSGFNSFVYNLDYPVDFIVRALPTIFSATEGDQPPILFWNDFVGRGSDNEWLYGLNQLGYKMGKDYDMYATNGPSSSVGNGLGSRATSAQLRGYSTLLYNAGDLSSSVLGNGNPDGAEPSDDIGVLRAWFERGDKNALFTGDSFVTSLQSSGIPGLSFVNDFLSVNYIQNAVGPLIGQQTRPLVKSIASNGVIAVNEWIVDGGCLGINTFDAVEPVGGAVQVAEWTDVNGNGGQYPDYAAAVYNQGPNGSEVVYLPYDLAVIWNAPGYEPPDGQPFPARVIILDEILTGFDEDGTSPPNSVELPAKVLTVSNFPNPFNPSTTIKMNLPKAGDVSLKVFNVRGELVKTLVDGPMIAGEHSVIWDGKTDAGNQTASGVYFYETRANGEVKINKMALVK